MFRGEGRQLQESQCDQTRQNKNQGKLRNIPQYLLMANQYENEANDHGDENDIDETDGESLARRY